VVLGSTGSGSSKDDVAHAHDTLRNNPYPHGRAAISSTQIRMSRIPTTAAACKALRAPATLPRVPHLVIRGQAKSVEYAHQAWRYGIVCSGSETVEAWLSAVANWLEDDR
jgi:hypothetical protein